MNSCETLKTYTTYHYLYPFADKSNINEDSIETPVSKSCPFSGTRYPLGESWFRRLDTHDMSYCVACVCAQGGKSNCTSRPCDGLIQLCEEATDLNELEKGCCQQCTETDETKRVEIHIKSQVNTLNRSPTTDRPLPANSCQHNGKTYSDNQIFASNTSGIHRTSANQCVQCICQAGLVLCRLKTCYADSCSSVGDNSNGFNEDCCPLRANCRDKPISDSDNYDKREGHLVTIYSPNDDSSGTYQTLNANDCKSGGKVYANGAKWHPIIGPFGQMDCVVCVCTSGSIECSRISCHKSSCLQTKPIQGQCCPICVVHQTNEDQKSSQNEWQTKETIIETNNKSENNGNIGHKKEANVETMCVPIKMDTICFRSHAQSSNSAYYQYAFQTKATNRSTILYSFTVKDEIIIIASKQDVLWNEYIAMVCRVTCLSLDEIHSSSKQFKSVSHNRDNSLKNAIETIQRRRAENPLAHLYGPNSLPLQAIQYYKRLVPLVPINTNPNVQLIEVPLEYNQIEDDYSDDSPKNDLYLKALALKLSKLSDYNTEQDSDVSNRILNRINKKKKRTRRFHPDEYSTITLMLRKKSLPIPKISKSKSDQKFENKNNKQTKVKKVITKRKVESQMALDYMGVNNESKTSPKDLKTTDKTVVSELNDILSDDSKTEKYTQTKQNETNSGSNKTNESLSHTKRPKNTEIKEIKTKNKRSSPLTELSFNDKNDENNDNNNENENIIIYPVENIEEKSELKIGKTSDGESPIGNQQLDEWLRREYYENIAKALATMRKKRSEDSFDYNLKSDDNYGINSIDDLNSIPDNLIAIDDSNEDNENERPDNSLNKNNGKLDESDDYVVAAVEDDIEGNDKNNENEDTNGRNERTDNESEDSVIWDVIEEKSRQKKKRSVNSDVEDRDNDETNDIDIDSQRFTRINTKLESIEDSLLNEAIGLIRKTAQKGSQSEAESNKIENRLDAAYDIEDMRNLTDNQMDNQDDNLENSLSRSESADNCFAIEMLSSDCSSVADLMPNSRLHESFTDACNWHHICYTCGEIYGLLSSDCDAGFLEASRLACEDSPSCESFARLVLKPLRQSRVFYKSSVPQTCFQYKCIKDFLFDSTNKKR
ncbi:unnamed protein product [Oppiella nova]|uniref:VWFC domain-containing protein n=1 Tax=Oppiella nova TaxID=334625 RepID=A0A7R9LSC3_9ACAR|nr:unnamed protein product [Oppiella nova]CAG2166148.1 unnamed protein product [Oppiella nova]